MRLNGFLLAVRQMNPEEGITGSLRFFCEADRDMKGVF